jgi:aminopeptidase N
LQYDITVTPDYTDKSIIGKVIINFAWKAAVPANHIMQIDLQEPLVLDSVIYKDEKLPYERLKNVFFIQWPHTSHLPDDFITLYYHGKPREARRPPWDGGWIWSKDALSRPWMTVACQGLGASAWFPCKDHQSDEPDNGAVLKIIVPDTLQAIGNGRLIKKEDLENNKTAYTWKVTSPVNIYNIVPYIGKYVHWSDSLTGETGKILTLDYWVLDYDLEKSKVQFNRDVKRMLTAFEYWFGPYPFYDDGYKLVESPHLGMEHQSAIAYGNHFLNGYLGRDLSGTGWGLKWDYIIIHESGHEWFANNISTKDIADMWVHEGFTMYSEVLFIEYYYGRKAADEYVKGLRLNISNNRPIIGFYGVNNEGSGDMYNKGANMIHTIRQVIHNDSLFRKIVRGLNKKYYHQTVDSKDIEKYMSEMSGVDLSAIFDQYLRTTMIPVLEYRTVKNTLQYRWQNVVPGFKMPLRLDNGKWIYPTTKWKTLLKNPGDKETLQPDSNFYITVKKTE